MISHTGTTRRCRIVAVSISMVLGACQPAFAQTPDQGDIWTIRAENDKISTQPRGSDRNYTNGVQASWMSGANKVPVYAGDFAHLLWGDGQVRVGLGFSQRIYTPSNLGLRNPDPRDRPYAGFLAGTGTLLHETATRQDILALTLGVIGPLALGEQVQNGFHRLIQVDTAKGWSHQLPNEGAAELLTQRTWRRPLGSFAGLDSDILPSLALGVGTVRDYVQSGIVFRIGQGLNTDFGPARIGPGINGSDAYAAAPAASWYVFSGVSGQAIGRDAFLDGALFSRSVHVDRNILVGELQAGVAVIWQGVRLTYTQTWQTEQYRHQRPGLFNFGSLTLSATF
jgi:lipid A 3-O-deacylase